MERNSHDSIRIVKCFLYTISMMNIDIQIEHSRVHFKQFQDANNDVIDIAEPTSLSFFGVMIPSCPIYGNIRDSCQNDVGSIHAPPSG